MVLHFKSETLTPRTQRGTCKSDGGMYVKLKVYLPYSVTSKTPCQKIKPPTYILGMRYMSPTLVYRPPQLSMMDEVGAMVKC